MELTNLNSQQSTQPAKLTTSNIPRINDRNDVNDPFTPTKQRQRQQQHNPRPRTHIEAASVGISPSNSPRARFAEHQQSEQHTHDLEDRPASSTDLASTSAYSPDDRRRPHRALRISKHTASAILYTLEEALRQPNPFTPDLVEENASMSGLAAGGPSAPAGNGRPGRIQVPGPTGSPIRGPRDIMREREAREKRKAEDAAREEMRKANAEEEARALEDEKRRSAERRAVAAGAAAQQRAGESAQRASGGTAGQRISDKSQRSDQQRVASGERQQESLQGVGRGGRALGGDEPAPKSRPAQSQSQRPIPPGSSRARPSQPGPSAAGPSNEAPQQASSTIPARSSFPHAFERWETLSAHWEGLTSFWIRRLEENSNEVNREPISQQLSRQVTDLSAAGANLFHAVVELQRLRASSERKFQRWFFETRAEQERAQEIQAMTENTLQAERHDRAQAILEAVENERKRSASDKQLAEMKRELQISKDEARRAWEELGRREQEERDRTIALREGHPVTIGGVQVVPMMQGVPSRHGSARTGAQHVQEPEGPVDDSDEAYQQYQRAQRAETDPFVEQHHTPTRATSRPTATAAYADYTQAPAVQPASAASGPYYHPHDDNTLHPVDPTDRSEGNQSRPSYGGSEGAMSEDEEYEIDAEGQFVRDARGNKIRYRSVIIDDGVDEYDAATARAREQAYFEQYGQAAPLSGVEYGRGATSTAGSTGRVAAPTSQPSTNTDDPPDYSGGGYGSGPGWEAVPRHHHPTRLSDVLEEDERSRTSASQVSGRHGGRE